LLADAQAESGALTEALSTVDDALSSSAEERIWQPHLLWSRGELLIRKAASDWTAQAENSFREAIALAHSIEARSMELRAATSLGRLLQSAGRDGEARGILAPLYASFTEGLDTRDLKEAKQLLDALEKIPGK